MTDVADEVTAKLIAHEYRQVIRDDLVNLICSYGFSRKFEAHVTYLGGVVGMDQAREMLEREIGNAWRKI